MKYHYNAPDIQVPVYGEKVLLTDHPAYTEVTLFREGNKGIAVTQLHFVDTQATKAAYWGYVKPAIANDIYMSPNFKKFFEEHAREAPFPIYQLRSIMWQLRMKPLKREEWEVYF